MEDECKLMNIRLRSIKRAVKYEEKARVSEKKIIKDCMREMDGRIRRKGGKQMGEKEKRDTRMDRDKGARSEGDKRRREWKSSRRKDRKRDSKKNRGREGGGKERERKREESKYNELYRN